MSDLWERYSMSTPTPVSPFVAHLFICGNGVPMHSPSTTALNIYKEKLKSVTFNKSYEWSGRSRRIFQKRTGLKHSGVGGGQWRFNHGAHEVVGTLLSIGTFFVLVCTRDFEETPPWDCDCRTPPPLLPLYADCVKAFCKFTAAKNTEEYKSLDFGLGCSIIGY
jgi:hypothetical protein